MENYDRIIKQDMEELWTRDLPYNKFKIKLCFGDI